MGGFKNLFGILMLQMVVLAIMSSHDVIAVAPSLSGPLLRMHFHDCFIRGCDGSVLLDSPTNQSEKFSIPNISLRGFNIIDRVKTELEKTCPGGHTLGMSHCSSFGNRLYNFTRRGDTDPTMDQNYIARLKLKCKPNDQTTIAELDPGSFKTFDDSYFRPVNKRRGLQSDAALLDDPETKAYMLQATRYGSTFFKDFGISMVKMGRIGVLT
nr:peroxidase 27-like [Tanacetum cinerariifolium]